jgi:hypothetical protein
MKLRLLNNATSADVTIHLSQTIPEGANWYKYSMDHGWEIYPEQYVSITADRRSITITLVDGGVGDDDGVVNGLIVDPCRAGHYARQAWGIVRRSPVGYRAQIQFTVDVLSSPQLRQTEPGFPSVMALMLSAMFGATVAVHLFTKK